MGKVFFISDTETTGFNPATADAIEVAILKVEQAGDKFKVLDSLDIYIDPGYPLPEKIVEFNEKNHTGINDALLAKSPSPKEAARKISDFFGWRPTVVGHNFESFDVGFIDKLYRQLDKSFTPKTIVDTLTLSRKFEPVGSHKLGVMFEKSDKTYSSASPKFHTAIADCYATLDVLDYLMKTHDSHILSPVREQTFER